MSKRKITLIFLVIFVLFNINTKALFALSKSDENIQIQQELPAQKDKTLENESIKDDLNANETDSEQTSQTPLIKQKSENDVKKEENKATEKKENETLFYAKKEVKDKVINSTTCANVETKNFSCRLFKGKVYVKGINTYGQLGLNSTNPKYKLTSEKAIPYLSNINKIEYHDYTLYMYNNSNIYVVGKNGFKLNLKTTNKKSLLKKASVCYPILIKGNKNNPSSLTTFNTNTLKTKNYTVLNSKVSKINYYHNNQKVKYYELNYHSNNNLKLHYYKNLSSKKEYRSYYNSQRQKTRYLKQFYLKGKKKTSHDYNYKNNILRSSKISKYYANGRKKQYDEKKYASNKRYTMKKITKYYNNGKKSYSYFASYDAKYGIRLGTTKSNYNKKGQLTYQKAKLDGLKYFSQHDKRWKNSKCNSYPYVGPFWNNGCMISSFSMLHSRYDKKINPLKVKNKVIRCFFNYQKAANIYGYNLQVSKAVGGYSRNQHVKFTNPKRYIGNNKTFKVSEAIAKKHLPVQIWTTPKKKQHVGHSTVAYEYVYKKGKSSTVYILDPWKNTGKRSLQSLANNQYLTRAYVYIKK